jgi:type IV fimbrial biogenesis protein FimT
VQFFLPVAKDSEPPRVHARLHHGRAVAVPSFVQAMDFVSAKQVAVELAGDMRQARSEALKRNTIVSVTPLSGGWSAGWQVRTSAGDLVSQHVTSRAGVNVGAPSGGVQFGANGRIANTDTNTADLKWTVSTGSSSGTRCVRLGVTGAANIQLGACT